MTEPKPAPAPVDETLAQRVHAAIYDTYGQQDRDRSNRIAAAVLAELAPELTRANLGDRTRQELASLAVNAANALRDEKRHYAIACAEITRLKDRAEEAEQALAEILAAVRTYRDADTGQPIHIPGHITDEQYQRWQHIAHPTEEPS